MAGAPKRRKLEKTPTQPQLAQPTPKFVCHKCGTAYGKRQGFFSVSHSPMYMGVGYLPLCVDCVDALYERYQELLGDERYAMRRICMKFDLYWHDDLFDMTERTSTTTPRVRSYIAKTNLIKYAGKTFDDTLAEEGNIVEHTPAHLAALSAAMDDELDDGLNPVESGDLTTVDQKTIDFWGPGYSASFYEDLDKKYYAWTDGSENIAQSERALYKKISLLEVTIERDGALGKPIDKNMNVLNTLLGSMNLKPTQKKEEANASLEGMPLGVGIQKWEYSRPLPETPNEHKDIRGTIKNITTWYLGHASKMVGLKNSYCKMYEDAIEELRVNNPEYADEDEESMLNDIFGGAHVGRSSEEDDGGE